MAGYCTLVLYFHSPVARENTDAHSCNIQPYCLLSHQIIYIYIAIIILIILSIDILVQIQKVLDIMIIRHYGIRPCGKTPLDQPSECWMQQSAG